MPSPTSSTRPTSRVSRRAPKWRISSVRTDVISSALNFMTASRDDLVLEVIQTGADGGVELAVADADLQPAQERRVDVRHQHRLQVEAPPYRLGDAAGVFVGQGHGGVDVHLDATVPLVVEVVQGPADRAEQV